MSNQSEVVLKGINFIIHAIPDLESLVTRETINETLLTIASVIQLFV